MSDKSGFPFRVADGVDSELVKYFVRIGQPIEAVDDLAATPTTTEIATAFNALLAALRAGKKMEQS